MPNADHRLSSKMAQLSEVFSHINNIFLLSFDEVVIKFLTEIDCWPINRLKSQH